jgi:hypothetical protein
VSRLFHTLVVAGAAISASACAGKSSRTDGDGDGGTSAGGGSGSGAVAGNGGTTTGGTGPAGGGAGPAGGSAGSPGGNTGLGGLPEPGTRAQWNCEGLVTYNECVALPGTTATPIPESCPVETDRPRSEADCDAGAIFTCVLAVTPSSEPVLVNCHCDVVDASQRCAACSNLEQRHGEPVYCDGVRKICACAYTGILR